MTVCTSSRLDYLIVRLKETVSGVFSGYEKGTDKDINASHGTISFQIESQLEEWKICERCMSYKLSTAGLHSRGGGEAS